MQETAVEQLLADAEVLRSKIIDAAIRGKLTNIDTRKYVVVLGNLPVKFMRGSGLKKSDLDDKGSHKCILYGQLFTKYNDPIISQNEMSRTSKVTSVTSISGDILVPGTSTAGKEQMILARELYVDNVEIGGDINIIRPLADGTFFPKYMSYVFDTQEAKRQLGNYITGTTGIIHVSNNGIRRLRFPLPPLAEQKRIVEKLDEMLAELDVISRGARAYQDDAKSLKSKIIDAAIRGKLTEQLPSDGNAEDLCQQIQAKKAELIKEGKIKKSKPLPPIKPDEIPFEIPKSWKWVRLGEVVGKEIKREKSPRYGKNKYAYAFAQKCNTKTNGIDLSRAKSISSESAGRYQKSDALREGDVVVNSTGAGTLGRVGIIDVTIPDGVVYYADSHVAVVRPLCNAQFIYYMVKSRENLLVSMGGGSTNQKELKPSDVASILIPLPPLAEQKRIVERLNSLLSKADDIASSMDTMS